jgi:hypothetical protein
MLKIEIEQLCASYLRGDTTDADNKTRGKKLMTTISAKIINKYVPTNNLLNSDIFTNTFEKILNRLAVNHSIVDGGYTHVYEFTDGSKLSHDVLSFKVYQRFENNNMQLLNKGAQAT